MKNILGIFSSKGGVGKTTIALNTALAMHQFGEDVILLDCDFKNSNLALHIGVYDFPLTIQDVIETNTNLLEAVHVHSSGLRIVPASISIREFKTDFDRLKEIFKGMKHHVIIDTPPGIGEDVTALTKLCDEVVVVTNPSIPAFTDSLKSIQLAKDFGKKIRGMIINRVEKRHAIRMEDIEKISGIPVLGRVPEDKYVRESLYYQMPVLIHKPHSKSSVEIKRIAANMLGREYSPPKFLFLRRLFS